MANAFNKELAAKVKNVQKDLKTDICKYCEIYFSRHFFYNFNILITGVGTCFLVDISLTDLIVYTLMA